MNIAGSMMDWHQKEINEVINELRSSLHGLSQEEARGRLKEYGPNELIEKKKKTPIMIFFEQFRDFMILVLIAAAVISGLVGEISDTIAIIVIVVLNAVIGFVQEYRAEKAIAALKKIAAPSAIVLRDGMASTISASELVPGDMVHIEAGRIVPADMRLIEAMQLKIEEAALTGESVPSEKHAGALQDPSLPLGDRKNMAYKGTSVSYGRGTGIIISTGMNTELGAIATMIQKENDVKTPLQKRLAQFGYKLAIAVLAICAIVFFIGMMRGEPTLLLLLTAISLAVAAIPEALPAVVTISLALGAKKMVKQNALIRKLPAVETLGSVTYICSDKTGTLTMNKMTVEAIYADRKMFNTESSKEKNTAGINSAAENFELKNFSTLFTALALSNDAKPGAAGSIIGDPTEVALYNIARDYGYNKEILEKEFPRTREIPFDSDRKCMTTFHRIAFETLPASEYKALFSAPSADLLTSRTPALISFTKGAAEVIIEKSVNILTSEGLKSFEPGQVLSVSEQMAYNGQRVLCIAMRSWDRLPDDLSARTEDNLTILGLVGMMDPPRDEAKKAVSRCKAAGIKPVMITGDHPLTAGAIARRLGIMEDGAETVITGKELENLPTGDFEKRATHIRVYARVAPEQKLEIVKALQESGEFVAMTGDGVNDAPALKRADIGIAMGITGTDVSKEASHMILLDDNFATIVRAVQEGRRIFDNVRKFVRYTMTSNSGEIWTIFLAPFLGLPLPLLPIHILWINLLTDGLPGLALAAEPAEKGIMERPPRHPRESIFAHGLWAHILWVGFLMGAVSISTQAWAIKTGNSHWQTMVFTVLCLSQMGNVLAIRSERESLFKQGIWSNKPLLIALIITFLLQMAPVYFPFLNAIFKTEPLTLGELMLTLALSSIVFFAVEIEKGIKRKKYKDVPF
jgi:Ca2+-transporting ATPase